MFIKLIDDFLNKITMYRLVLYCLVFLWTIGLMLSFFGLLPFKPFDLLISSTIIYASCIIVNIIYELIFKAPSNPESTYITALILSLIVGPEKSMVGFMMLGAVSFIAISSKYLISINRKHIFNPAGFSIAISAYAMNYYPSWWIGDINMIWFVVLIGLLVTRKIQRFDLVLSFLIVFTFISLTNITSLPQAFSSLESLFTHSSILFLAFIMLTEPSTTPPTRIKRILYGSFVGLLSTPLINFQVIYFSPELALLTGNILSYLISYKSRLVLTLKEIKNIAENTYDFIFSSDKKLVFKAGQYMEWNLKHKNYDDRGVRRYFTIASSPTESFVRIGVKIYERPSTFKKNLMLLKTGETVVASELMGEFVLPEDKNKKLVFIAGGIGVTPFRSMVKYLIDKNEKRDIVMFYAANSFADVSYKEIFDLAQEKLNLKIIYVLKDVKDAPDNLLCESGFINEEMILKYVNDARVRLFYISGPRSMVTSFKEILKSLGVSRNSIKTDFFPGYA